MTDLEQQYRERRDGFLQPAAAALEVHLRQVFRECHRIDRVSARAKAVDRFLEKALKQENGREKYTDPLKQIQDQIGARIVAFYLSDVETVKKIALKYLRPIESKVLVPDSENEFGYVGHHFILVLPLDVTDGIRYDQERPAFFELQIKTLFQHAWAEAGHDVAYKPAKELTPVQKRKIAFTAAQAWGADQIFEDLLHELANRTPTVNETRTRIKNK